MEWTHEEKPVVLFEIPRASHAPVRFGSEVYRFVYAAKRKTAEIERAFRESINSFRRMSLTESNATKPLRLKVVTATVDDTAESFASGMAITDRPLERFRVLNGLAATDHVKPGDRVKVVVE